MEDGHASVDTIGLAALLEEVVKCL